MKYKDLKLSLYIILYKAPEKNSAIFSWLLLAAKRKAQKMSIAVSLPRLNSF